MTTANYNNRKQMKQTRYTFVQFSAVLLGLSYCVAMQGQSDTILQETVRIVPTAESAPLFGDGSQDTITLIEVEIRIDDVYTGVDNPLSPEATFDEKFSAEITTSFMDTLGLTSPLLQGPNHNDLGNPFGIGELDFLFNTMQDIFSFGSSVVGDVVSGITSFFPGDPGLNGNAITDVIDGAMNFGVGVRWDLESTVGVKYVHGVGDGNIDLSYPIDVEFEAGSFTRGDTITVKIDSSYVANHLPTLNIDSITNEKELLLDTYLEAAADLEVKLGVLGQFTVKPSAIGSLYEGASNFLDVGNVGNPLSQMDHLAYMLLDMETSIFDIGKDSITGELGFTRYPQLTPPQFETNDFGVCVPNYHAQDGTPTYFIKDGEYSIPSEADYETNLVIDDPRMETQQCAGIPGNPCVQEYDPQEHFYLYQQLVYPAEFNEFIASVVQHDDAEDAINSFLQGAAELAPISTDPWFTTSEELTYNLELTGEFDGLGDNNDSSGDDDNAVESTLGIDFTLRRTANELDETFNSSSGKIKAQTNASEVEPYASVQHDILETVTELLYALHPTNPYLYDYEALVCGQQEAPPNWIPYYDETALLFDIEDLDGSRAFANLQIEPFEDDEFNTGLYFISIWDILDMSPLGATMMQTPWWNFSYSDLTTIADIRVGYDLADLTNNLDVSNLLSIEYTPEYRVRIDFEDETEFSLDNGATWLVSDSLDIALSDASEFQIATKCDDYEIAFEPTLYAVENNDLRSRGSDRARAYLDLNVMAFDVQLIGGEIIPAFGFDFLCVDSWESFGNSVVSCFEALLEWVEGAWCCATKIFCLGFCGGCDNCWKDTGKCKTCNYGFPGLTLPKWSMQNSTGYTGFGYELEYFDAQYPWADETRSLDIELRDESNEEYVPEELSISALPFELYDIDPTALANHKNTRSAGFKVDRLGGREPLVLISEDKGRLYASAHPDFQDLAEGANSVLDTDKNPIDVEFDLDESDESIALTSLLSNYRLKDANGCFADFVAQDVVYASFGEDSLDYAPEMLDVPLPYTINDSFCSDEDNDGCNDCASGAFDLFDDGFDFDGDGICDKGDNDDDNDLIPDQRDKHPKNKYICIDSDRDGCDDCGESGYFDPANDGDDFDGDGLCNDGDEDDDNDGVIDALDNLPQDTSECGDSDNDGCNDCALGDYDPSNDGNDSDGDGICDIGDPDIDNDGVANDEDGDPDNQLLCADADQDGCDDCSQIDGIYHFGADPNNDGLDTDGDGICNLGEGDSDGDGVDDDEDPHPYNKYRCGDAGDQDSCDDCGVSGYFDPDNDGDDLDGDGICDFTDSDIDGDGVVNSTAAFGTTIDLVDAYTQVSPDSCQALDRYRFDPHRCGDCDSDGYDDCLSGQFNPLDDCYNFDSALGIYVAIPNGDMDGDGLCNEFDKDQDGDGVQEAPSQDGLFDSIPDTYDVNGLDQSQCYDLDKDGCDDCNAFDFSGYEGFELRSFDLYEDVPGLLDTVYVSFEFEVLQQNETLPCMVINDVAQVLRTRNSAGLYTCSYQHPTLNHDPIECDSLVVDSNDCEECECILHPFKNPESISNYSTPPDFEQIVVINDGVDNDGDGVCSYADFDDSDDSKYLDSDNDQVPACRDCNDDSIYWGEAWKYYEDADGDGYANPSVYKSICYDADGDGLPDEAPIEGWICDLGDPSTLEFDCDDTDDTIHPGVDEVCGDNADNNCNGSSDEYCGD